MLEACATRIKAMPSHPLVWVDFGGGTAWNIEEMERILGDLSIFRVFTFSSVGQSILSLFFILKHCLVIINHVSREVHLSTDYTSFTTLL